MASLRYSIVLAYLAGLAFGVLPAATAAQGQDIEIKDLQNANFAITIKYRGIFARERGSGPGNITHIYRIKVGPEDNVQVAHTRNVEAITPVGTKNSSLNRNFSGKIGTPAQDRSGNYLWLLEKNQLLMLRTLEVGGFKLTIALSSSEKGMTCRATAPYLKEAGKDAGKTASAFGGNVRIVSMQQTSSSCTVSKAGSSASGGFVRS